MHHHQKSTKKQEPEMDGDFWASKFQSSKDLSGHLNSGNRLVLDDSEVNDDARLYFPCPFCYVKIELSELCDHLQGKHCFDAKNEVCPLCELNLNNDVAGHFRSIHMNSYKTRRRSQKSGFWSIYSEQMLGNLNTRSSSENGNALAPDPLLSPFFFSIPNLETRDQSENLCSVDDLSSISESESSKSSILNQSEEKEDSEELRMRTEFCQQLIFSTII